MSSNCACVSDNAHDCIERRYNTDIAEEDDGNEYCQCPCHDDPYDE